LSSSASQPLQRGYCVGTAGNISVAHPGGFLMTPTNSSLGRLDAARISRSTKRWNHVAATAQQEVFLHRAFLAARPRPARWCTCTAPTPPRSPASRPQASAQPIPPLRLYFVMRVGRTLPVIPYYRPGDAAMEPAIHAAPRARPCLLRPITALSCSAATSTTPCHAAEELEEAARLALLLRSANPRVLSTARSRTSATFARADRVRTAPSERVKMLGDEEAEHVA
jgi:ribulose-5-phosphate 4-epimerase/fuculose-1-phosphate aldolase